MIAKCNECEESQKMIPHKKKLKDKIEKHYFQCKYCKHVYVICYTDQDIRREQNRIRKLIKKNSGNGLYEDKIESKKKLITIKMDELKQSIESTA